MYCKECGHQIADDSKFCASCGKPQDREVVSNPEKSNTGLLELKDEIKKLRQEELYHRLKQDQSKSKLIAFLLCFFWGGLGAHRFYVGKTGTGVLMLLFTMPSVIIFYATRDIEKASTITGISAILMVIFGIWVLIDLIRIITGSFIESNYYEFSETGQKYL
jgi:TM2 domain-containing membrane protein YozV